MKKEFQAELTNLLNRHSIDSEMDTPDYVLSAMICGLLRTVRLAQERRRKWFGLPKGSALIVGTASLPEVRRD